MNLSYYNNPSDEDDNDDADDDYDDDDDDDDEYIFTLYWKQQWPLVTEQCLVQTFKLYSTNNC